MRVPLNGKFLKHAACYAVVILLFAFAVLPAVTAARTRRSSSYTATTSKTWLQYDGSSEPLGDRQRRIREYREQSGGLQQKISALGDTASTVVMMPVLFGVGVQDIEPNFGDPRDGGARTHEGEDIMAVKGTPIISPTNAVVTHTSTNAGASEGIAVYTANPGGETFVYYHLDRIGEGVVSGLVLAQGSLIGYVGNTGNASGGPAHLHFEIHNSSGTPVDPFPRLTGEFSLQEKIGYLSVILAQTSDSIALSRFLVTNFRGVFISAIAGNITLPLLIMDALAFIPTTGSVGGSLPISDLDIGSSGAAVVALQKYLIQADSGVAALRLADAGATGYFGVITKAALVEFQVAAGISPPDGHYGSATRAFIAAHPLWTSSSPAITEGALIRAAGDIDVYIVKYKNGKQFKRLILSPKVFNSYGHLRWENVITVTRTAVDTFAISDLVRATVAQDPKVYRLYPSGDIGEKRWIKTAEAFVRLGYDWDAVYEINSFDRDSYLTGIPLE
ncbi:MAG: peptidoglycan DD-metalloendopeptidase family protein [bacterium]|nr:peptidoglycan DD-metalloendopeptidase family protein [bacterium]